MKVLWLSPWMRPLARIHAEALRAQGDDEPKPWVMPTTCPDCGTILRPPAVGKSNEVGPLVGVIRHRP